MPAFNLHFWKSINYFLFSFFWCSHNFVFFQKASITLVFCVFDADFRKRLRTNSSIAPIYCIWLTFISINGIQFLRSSWFWCFSKIHHHIPASIFMIQPSLDAFWKFTITCRHQFSWFSLFLMLFGNQHSQASYCTLPPSSYFLIFLHFLHISLLLLDYTN